jgi:hypothetical protein
MVEIKQRNSNNLLGIDERSLTRFKTALLLHQLLGHQQGADNLLSIRIA